MYKIIVEAYVNVTEEVQILTEYDDYYDSYEDEVICPYLLQKLQFEEEDNLVEYFDEDIKNKLQNNSFSKFTFKDNKLVINSEFIATKRLTKTELNKLKEEVSAQYSDGYFESNLRRNIYNGKKYKDYYLSIDWNTITIKQTKLDA